MPSFRINKSLIDSKKNKTYFIADIAANHDGSLNKAIELIHMCAECGVDAAKFQNFYAETIVSDKGFKDLKKKFSHQSKWKQSVFDTYKKAEVPLIWTEKLSKACKKYKIDYFTAPYDFDVPKKINKYVSAWKVGSGDITWHDHILNLAKFNKPILIATGASSFKEVELVYRKVSKINKKIVIMQCNTNYTAQRKNFKYINLNVIKYFKKKFPNAVIGLSDHTHGHETVLGAITLGARVIEKHFTDNNNRKGPDHYFSMNPKTMKDMIEASRNLELALGNDKKKIEYNEKETVIVQRRSLRYKNNFPKGYRIKSKDLIALRPCPSNAYKIYEVKKIIGLKLKKRVDFHDYVKKSDF